jgi:hypothetical protein
MPRETDFKQNAVRRHQGFSLHAAVRCGADDRQALEQLCRYITRPALANERVQTNAAGAGGAQAQDPLARRHHAPGDVARWSSCSGWPRWCPRPRLHLIRFHGVLAPNAKLRALVVPQVVPQESEPAAQASKATCRVRGEVLAPSQAGAAELGPAAEAGVRRSTWSTARTAAAS